MTYSDRNPPVPTLKTHGFFIDEDGRYHDEIGPFEMDVIFEEDDLEMQNNSG